MKHFFVSWLFYLLGFGNTSMIKGSTKKLIFAAAALFVSLCLVFGAVFAWFTTSDSVGTDGLDFGVPGDDSNGGTITSINGAKPDEKIILYPEGTLTVGLKITDDIKNFGVKLAADARDDNFNAFFAAREDLLFGVYEKGEIISDASGNMAEYWRNFDAAAPLSSLSETERLSAQVGFLHEFALQNSLHDAMQLVAVVNEKEYPLTKENDNEIYRNSELTVLASATEFTLYVQFGTNGFTPEIQLPPDVLPHFESGTYRALNYNCFLNHEIKLSFENGNV